MSSPTASLLALDTATDTLAVAVGTPQGRWAHEAPGGPQASAQLIPQALALLARAGIQLPQVDAIAFGRGPGAFTGLRTACSVAQGLALGAGKPVLAIDSLLIVAEDARAQLAGDADLAQDMWVAMDARMGEIYAQGCRWDGHRWQLTTEALLCTPEALLARWQTQAPAAVAGSALSAYAERLPLPAGTRPIPNTQSRAQALLRLAEAAWADGASLDPALALPVYVRDKVAQTTAERMAERPAAAPT